jgi:hypothetical protein
VVVVQVDLVAVELGFQEQPILVAVAVVVEMWRLLEAQAAVV